ncbi:MAG: flagellar protein [Negativicutes bacterium]|nr:flagellar protein [Negativicutes bacterium]
MNLTNCQECGGVMVENPSGMCAACLRNEDLAEDKVAEYLRDASRASLDEIAKATGVKPKVILRMLKRGRITSNAQISYPCETCGGQILSGRLCDNCTKVINDQLKTEAWQPAAAPTETKKDTRMYIRDLLDKK